MSGRGFTIGSTSYTLNYSHNAEGQITAVLYPDNNQASYSYSKGVVSGITLTVGGTNVSGASAITYRPGDLAMSGWTSSNGLTNTLGYDSDGRLTGIAVPGIENLGFSYDVADRITGITNGIDTGQSEAFDYDEQSRLTGVYGGSETESYSYDADGNRLTQTINGTSATFTYGAINNRLTGISGAVTTSYGYDAQGNTTTTNGSTTFGYNPFNRLSSASGASDYVNPEGQRLRKVTSSGTTYFAPDAGGPLLAESIGGAWIDYVWLNGRLVGRMASNTVDAIHDDQAGRPQVVTNASKTVVWKATNYPFERVVTQDSIGGLNLGFPGQYYDAERGTWNNGFRDYNASLGRYVESDPMGLNGGINTYAYVSDDPLMKTDPYGLCGCGNTMPTKPSSDNLDKDISLMRSLDKLSIASGVMGQVIRYEAFYDLVRNKGPWDFKQQGRQYEDYGNFHYGVVGTAAGIPASILLRAAGWAQTRSGNYVSSNGSPFGGSPYGDDSKDQDQIKDGIWWYEHCYSK